MRGASGRHEGDTGRHGMTLGKIAAWWRWRRDVWGCMELKLGAVTGRVGGCVLKWGRYGIGRGCVCISTVMRVEQKRGALHAPLVVIYA